MFYTKYRPQKFSEISKPNETATALMNQIVQKKTAHAYLFHGSRGTGKTTTARLLAKALNCQKPEKDGDPCGKCENCLAISNGTFPDLIEIDAASNRGIDDIRDLREKIKLAPSYGKKKIYIIDEVHMLTNEAFNALLKTLEEPPAHAVFILATTELHKVPETIKSRCQVFKFKRATVNQLIERMQNIAKAEKIKISEEDLRKIALASFGGFRDAETLLQQVAEGDVKADSLLSIGSPESYAGFLDLLLEKDLKKALKYLNKIYEEGADLYVWTGEFIKYLRDLLFITAGVGKELSDISDEIYSKMKEQADSLNPEKITAIITPIMKAQNEIKGSFITQLPVELALTEVCNKKEIPVEVKGIVIQESIPVAKKEEEKDEGVKKSPHKVEKAKNEADREDDDEDEEEEEKEEIKEKPAIKLDKIKEKWTEVLKKTSSRNSSIEALLKSGNPVNIEGHYILMEVFYSFHKERLESIKNRKVVEEVLSEVFELPLSYKCHVSVNRPAKSKGKEVGDLTDYNVVTPSSSGGSPLDIFDGKLPLG